MIAFPVACLFCTVWAILASLLENLALHGLHVVHSLLIALKCMPIMLFGVVSQVGQRMIFSGGVVSPQWKRQSSVGDSVSAM